jgi:tRNA(Ile)-lysidine synthase
VRKQEGAAAIAVAHTLDDQAETLLMRLLRGAGTSGLGGMRPRAGDILRPLLSVSRAEVLAHLRERGLAWREDPSNVDFAHARNRVRHELLPYLESRFNPAVRETLARSAWLLADEAALLRAEASKVVEGIARREGEAIVLPRAELRALHPALGRAVVRETLARAGGLARVGAMHVERILEMASRAAPSGRRLPLPGRREASFRFGEIRLGPRREAASAFVRPLPVPGRVELPDGAVIEAWPMEGSVEAGAQGAVAVPEGEPLVVRTRRPGDRVMCGGRELSLTRLLVEENVPAEERGELPLVAAGSRVLWVAGRSLAASSGGGPRIGLRLVARAAQDVKHGGGR